MDVHVSGTREDRGIADLLKDLRDETTTLLKQEVALAKTEVAQKGSRIGRNVGYLAAGGLVAYAGLLFILAALSSLTALGLRRVIDAETAMWLAPLIIGGIVAVIGYTLVQKAISTLKSESLVPEQTVASLQENTQWVKQKAK